MATRTRHPWSDAGGTPRSGSANTPQYRRPSDFPKGFEQHALASHAAPAPVGHRREDPPSMEPLEAMQKVSRPQRTSTPDSLRKYQKTLAPKKGGGGER